MNDQKELGIVVGQLRHMTQDIHELKSDVKMLLSWRWKLYGMNAAISVIASAIMLMIFGR